MEFLNKTPMHSNENVVSREVDGDLLVLDQANNKIHKLNALAAFIWSNCDGNTPINNIITMIEKEFSEDRETIQNDVFKLLKELENLQLLAYKT